MPYLPVLKNNLTSSEVDVKSFKPLFFWFISAFFCLRPKQALKLSLTGSKFLGLLAGMCQLLACFASSILVQIFQPVTPNLQTASASRFDSQLPCPSGEHLPQSLNYAHLILKLSESRQEPEVYHVFFASIAWVYQWYLLPPPSNLNFVLL